MPPEKSKGWSFSKISVIWSATVCRRFIMECGSLLPLSFAIACYRFFFPTGYRRFTVHRIMGDSELSPYQS
ncbi:MAG: hypothetical protein ACUVQH_14940, partial [Thermogutta sp.]